ncbi:MAG: ABC transporter substrate-binding protein [Rhodospirillales bacterium]|nr:ABC transporter substrate-binding protein [Rhodospirillales bacterium]
MLKKFGLVGALVGIVLSAGFGVSVKADAIEDGSRQFIQVMADQAIQSLRADGLAQAERVKRFRVLFNDNFAVKSIGKFVLGRYWRKANDDEKKEYLSLFEDLMVISYVDRFGSYAGNALKLKNARTENKTTVTVFSEIKRPGGAKPIHIDWRVGTNGTIYKVLDVVVEGASMSSTMRSDFGSIIRQKNGKVSGLIDELKKKNRSLQAEMQNQ